MRFSDMHDGGEKLRKKWYVRALFLFNRCSLSLRQRTAVFAGAAGRLNKQVRRLAIKLNENRSKVTFEIFHCCYKSNCNLFTAKKTLWLS